jgi:hypothetical protein
MTTPEPHSLLRTSKKSGTINITDITDPSEWETQHPDWSHRCYASIYTFKFTGCLILSLNYFKKN